MTTDYLSAGMLAPCPDSDAVELSRIEVSFAFPVWMTQDQQRRVVEAIDDITSAPWNQPKDGVHWLAETGVQTNWSQADAAFLGIPADPSAPATGEPTFDDSVFHVGTCARGFVSDKERKRKEAFRAATRPKPGQDRPLYELCEHCDHGRANPGPDDTCPTCGGRTVLPVGVTTRQLDRMADRERALTGDPGLPVARRKAILERLRDKATAALERLEGE